MQKTDTLYTAYVEVLKEELLPAMGCTCLLYTSPSPRDTR